MIEEKKSFKEWVKAHKKELIIAGVSSAVLISLIFSIKNKDTLKELWNSMIKHVEKVPANIPKESLTSAKPDMEEKIIKFPVDRSYQNQIKVRTHLRKLPQGYHASAEKRALAAENNINLPPDYTVVEEYTKSYPQAM